METSHHNHLLLASTFVVHLRFLLKNQPTMLEHLTYFKLLHKKNIFIYFIIFWIPFWKHSFLILPADYVLSAYRYIHINTFKWNWIYKSVSPGDLAYQATLCLLDISNAWHKTKKSLTDSSVHSRGFAHVLLLELILMVSVSLVEFV